MKKIALVALFFVSGVHAQTLRIGLAEDPDALDPTLARTFVGRIVFAGLCDKLFDLDEKLNIVPQLATGYEWAKDNKSVTLKIRSGEKTTWKSSPSRSRDAAASAGATRPRVVPTGTVVSIDTVVPAFNPRPMSAITASRMPSGTSAPSNSTASVVIRWPTWRTNSSDRPGSTIWPLGPS